MEEKNKFNFSSTFQLMENTNGEKYELIVNYVKGILVVLTICTTLTLFSLPIIFYYITVSSKSFINHGIQDIKIINRVTQIILQLNRIRYIKIACLQYYIILYSLIRHLAI